MSDAPALDEWEEKARARLVALCREMLSGQTSFLEGVGQVYALRAHIRVHDHDPDMIPFTAVASETDHLPLLHVRPLKGFDDGPPVRIARSLAEFFGTYVREPDAVLNAPSRQESGAAMNDPSK